MKNVKIPKFWSPPDQPTPEQLHLPAPFSQAVGQKSKFRSQHFFASSSRLRKGMTQPPCPKTLGGDRFGRKVPF